MPNWSYNQIFVKGTKSEIVELFKKVAPKKVVINTIDDVIDNAKQFTLCSWSPTPKTFIQWDTTNEMRSFESWLSNPHTTKVMKKIAKDLGLHYKKDIKKQIGWGDMEKYLTKDYKIAKSKIGSKITLEQHHELEKQYVEPIVKELHKKYCADYMDYCDGYNNAVEYQKNKYGIVGWYDYNLATLGTKWDVKIDKVEIYNNEDDNFIVVLFCDTAWDVPYAWLRTMQKNNPNLSFGVYAVEENRSFVVGYDVKNNNEIVQTDLYSIVGDNWYDYEKQPEEWEEREIEREQQIEDIESNVFDEFVRMLTM